MGGLFAQTSGLPLKLSIQGNEMAYQDSFFPQLSTLGDVLNEAGYKQYFMMGSDAAFGGRKNYFTSHGDYEIDDYYWAISEGLIPEGYYQWWGYEDAKLFEYAKDKLTEISKNDEPFNFSMLTVATHFEDGYTKRTLYLYGKVNVAWGINDVDTVLKSARFRLAVLFQSPVAGCSS